MDFFNLPKNPVIILSRPDRIGDVVITSSCFAPIHEKYPDARIYLLARKDLQPLFARSPYLAGFIPLPEMAREEEVLRMLCELKPDVVVHFQPHPVCQRLAQRARVPVRIGWRHFPWTRTLTHAFSDRRAEGKKHEALYNFDLLECLGVFPPSRLQAAIHPPEEARVSLAAKLGTTPFVVLNPTTARAVRRWPAERFARLAQWLCADKNMAVVSIGASEGDLREFAALSGDLDIVRLEGKLNLAELAWLLRAARLLVTCDTGPSHIAAAVGCPQVTIFGRTEPPYGPARWRPLSDRVVLVSTSVRRRFFEPKRVFWRRGFDSISVEMVQEAVEKVLGDRPKR
ncbi:MAG: glycosyltransferase family 9 protein [bacterium]